MALLNGLLTTLFVILCFMLIFIILLQKGKGGTGLFSNMGNANVKLFGGSGGQDVFQKTTWVLGFLFLAGSLALALMRNSGSMQRSRILNEQVAIPLQTEQASTKPQE
ncbi:MAG: preprotein translocase subunit SecG [Candidatus Babeliaceae bacterium]|nr:preprotein translocase subunit SecG [Candidatus Babeliaceae bacterium]